MKTFRKLSFAMIIALAFASCGSEKQIIYVQQPAQQQAQQTTPQQSQPAQQPIVKPTPKPVEPTNTIDPKLSTDPCGDYYDDDEYMRDYGIATAANMNTAQKQSIKNAKDNLRQHMAEYIQGFTTTYAAEYSKSTEPVDDIVDKVENKMKAQVEGMLNRARKICQQREQDGRGNWIYYAAFEIPVEEFKTAVKNEMNALPQEDKDRIDYQEYRFNKTMDEEYYKMSEARKKAGY